MSKATTRIRLDATRTPQLAARLRQLGRALARQAWLSGLSAGALVALATLAFAFASDYWLRVPTWIRVLHGAAVVVLSLLALERWLVRALRRQPDARELALLLERAHPGQQELLVTAVDLEQLPEAATDEERAARARLWAAADARAQTLDAGAALDRRPVLARVAAAAAALVLAGVLAAREPELAALFARRLFGSTQAWPQRTHLSIEIAGGPAASVEPTPQGLRVRLALGSDLPVLVRVDGREPELAELVLDSGERIELARVGKGLFRASLRNLRAPLAFWAVGGDDQDEQPRAEIEVLSPPELEHVALALEPPAYTGLPQRIELDRDVQVPQGTRIGVFVLTRPADAAARLVLLPEERVLALAAGAFPELPEAAGLEPALRASARASSFVAERSAQLRVELEARGIANAEAGAFAIEVQLDRPPRVQFRTPELGELETTPGGRIALRAQADDDYGLGELRFELVRMAAGQDASQLLAAALPLEALDSLDSAQSAPAAEAPRALRRARAGTRIELGALAGLEPGAVLELSLEAADARDPNPQRGRAGPVRVRVFSPDELLRRLQEELARTRARATALVDDLRVRRARALELVEGLGAEGALGNSERALLVGLLGAQRRVGGDCAALGRALAGLCERALYARLDEQAGELLGELDARLDASEAGGFAGALYLDLARSARARGLGRGGLCAQLLHLSELALEPSEELLPSVERALASAEAALEVQPARAALGEAVAGQERALARLEELLSALSEWDDFQAVLSQTRELLERQKALRDRTRRTAAEK